MNYLFKRAKPTVLSDVSSDIRTKQAGERLKGKRISLLFMQEVYFAVARQKGLTNDPIKYFAAKENRDLGIVKSIRKPPVRLIVAPFPERQKNSADFFFSPNSQTLLTTAIQA